MESYLVRFDEMVLCYREEKISSPQQHFFSEDVAGIWNNLILHLEEIEERFQENNDGVLCLGHLVKHEKYRAGVIIDGSTRGLHVGWKTERIPSGMFLVAERGNYSSYCESEESLRLLAKEQHLAALSPCYDVLTNRGAFVAIRVVSEA